MGTQRKDNNYCNKRCPQNCSRYGTVLVCWMYQNLIQRPLLTEREQKVQKLNTLLQIPVLAEKQFNKSTNL